MSSLSHAAPRRSSSQFWRSKVRASIPLWIVFLSACDFSPRDDTPLATLHGERLSANAEIREVLQHPDVFERVQRIAQILQRSEPDQLESLRNEFETAALERGDLEYVLFANWWARFDPQAAFTFCYWNLRFDHPRVILEVVRVWGRVDPLGAVASGSLSGLDLQMPDLLGEWVDQLVVGWFESGKPGLEEWIVGLDTSDAAAAGMKALARMHVLRDGDEKTLEWIRTNPLPEDYNRALLAGALTVIARQNPELAIRWIDVAAKDGVDTRTFVPRIARSWATKKPLAAIEWLHGRPDDLEKFRAMNDIGYQWGTSNPTQMQEWIESQRGEAWTDSLRHQSIKWFIPSMHYRVDWNHLMDETAVLEDEQRRTELHAWILQRWWVADSTGAATWLETHPGLLPDDLIERTRGISESERKQILESIGSGSAEPATPRQELPDRATTDRKNAS